MILFTADWHIKLGQKNVPLPWACSRYEMFFEQIEDFKPEVGFKTNFIIEHNERTFHHMWKVIKVNAPFEITYNWKYKGYEGDSNVSFVLEALPNNDTQLTLQCNVVEDFPQDIPEFKRQSGVDGWHYFIKDALKSYLDG